VIDGISPEGTLCLCGQAILDRRFEVPTLWLLARGAPVSVDH
jgi:hypothetical protein